MRIRWHGHSCFEINNTVVVLTDPHDGKSIGLNTPSVKADIVIVSHEHFDHNCTRVVKGDFKIVNEPIKTVEKNVRILGLKTFHDDAKGMKRGENTIFKFTMDNTSFCHLGDLGHILPKDLIDKLGEIDVLFIPVGNIFTIDDKSAWKITKDINPKVVVPMHYRIGGLALSIKPVDSFLTAMKEEDIIRVGNEIEFTKEDLPEKLKIWVFTL